MAKQYEADYPGYYKKIVSKAVNFGLPIDLPRQYLSLAHFTFR